MFDLLKQWWEWAICWVVLFFLDALEFVLETVVHGLIVTPLTTLGVLDEVATFGGWLSVGDRWVPVTEGMAMLTAYFSAWVAMTLFRWIRDVL